MSPRLIRSLLVGAVALLLVGTAGVAGADPRPPAPSRPASPPADASPATDRIPMADDLEDPLEANRRELRDRALQDVLAGRRSIEDKAGSRVVRLGTREAPLTRSQQAKVRGGRAVTPRTVEQYVEVSRARTDRVFVLLVQFGNDREPRYPDQDTTADIPGPTTFAGPLHNTIPAPDRRRDNTTIWQRNFDRAYYERLYFGSGEQSVKSYYERQSSGRYSIEGGVSDWVTVPFNQARYGRSNGYPCAVNVCANSWYLVKDAVNAWVEQQRGAGRSDDEIAATLASYDVWDRYDHDGDGVFNERDGYLDHLQIVHAGGDQAADDPSFGEDAIWSHRWRAFQNQEEGAGPEAFPIGGTQVGTTGIWAADYAMQAENAGLSVFAHEYGHDLGLPDHYDTADPGDNPVNWWTLMGQSRLRAGRDLGVGTRAADLGAWDKFALGWLNYTVAAAGSPRRVELGPHEYNSAKPQAVIVTLPPKQVRTALPTPAAGERQWWSGTGDSYASGLARFVALPAASSAKLTFRANYNIEDCGPDACDYAYVEVGTGSGAGLTFTPIPGTITSAAEGQGIAGDSNGWVSASFDLSAWAGRQIALRFRYATNAGTRGADPDRAAGLFVDDIAVTADDTTVFADGAEGGDYGWTVLGFRNVGSSVTASYDHYYLASYRTGLSYDRYLTRGPYHFGWASTRPRRAEFFSYEKGLLVSYWDTSQTDNNTSVHPGSGLVLPIDARPAVLRTSSGRPWRGRVQTFDAPFSLRPSRTMVLHDEGRANLIRGTTAQPLFDDTRSYWSADLPTVGVKTPGVGVTLQVSGQTASTMTVDVGAKSGSPAAALTRR